GNHDHQSDTDRSAYERIFPEQINYSFAHRGWQIIGLDSSEGTKSKATKISAASLTWLDQNLSKLDLRRPTILFTHFPLGDSVLARPLNADDLLERCYGLNLQARSEEHTSELQSRRDLVCRLLLEKKNT